MSGLTKRDIVGEVRATMRRTSQVDRGYLGPSLRLRWALVIATVLTPFVLIAATVERVQVGLDLAECQAEHKDYVELWGSP